MRCWKCRRGSEVDLLVEDELVKLKHSDRGAALEVRLFLLARPARNLADVVALGQDNLFVLAAGRLPRDSEDAARDDDKEPTNESAPAVPLRQLADNAILQYLHSLVNRSILKYVLPQIRRRTQILGYF